MVTRAVIHSRFSDCGYIHRWSGRLSWVKRLVTKCAAGAALMFLPVFVGLVAGVSMDRFLGNSTPVFALAGLTFGVVAVTITINNR